MLELDTSTLYWHLLKLYSFTKRQAPYQNIRTDGVHNMTEGSIELGRVVMPSTLYLATRYIVYL